ncbi:MAG: TSUP family transporter [Bythopirellula sp.]|nr:TSUP family transporter [Bythopirellula sp.]
MLYPLHDLLIIGIVMTFGSIIQGAVGFASGLLGVPLLVLCGFSIPEAATINLVSTSVQNFTGAWKLWEHLDFKELIYPTVIRLCFAIPLGTYAAGLVDEFVSPDRTKQLLGALLLTVLFLLWLFKVQARDELNVFWQTLAFASSGFLLGFASMGAAPLVIYANSLTWNVSKSRAFLFFCSAVGQPFAALFFWLKFGEKVITPACSMLIFLPLIFAGLWLGLHMGTFFSVAVFRRITFGLIALTAVAAILSPFL